MPVTIEPLTTSWAKKAPIPWSKLEINAVRYNEVGSFSLTVPATERTWDLVQFDGGNTIKPVGLFCDWNGVFQVPLLAETCNPVRTVDDNGGVTELLTFAGADMFALLANRIVYRNAGAGWASQTVGTTVLTDPAETVIKDLVAANMVTASDTDRRVPGLSVATDLGRGGTATYTIYIKDPATTNALSATIGASLMDMIREVARQSNIGVRLDLVGGGLVLDCYLPRDLSEKAVFSPDLGNLRAWNITDAVPTSNAILMQSGAASGAFSETSGVGDADPWRRVETYADQTSTTDAAQIAQAKLDEVARGGPVTKLGLTALDIPRLRFGPDAAGIQGYGLGDLVTVDLRDGVVYTDYVSAVQLTADRTGATYTETVTPTIGAPDTDTGDDASAVAKLAAQVRRLERKLRNTS